MKATPIIILAFALCSPLGAQTLKPKVISDDVQKAIDEFNRLRDEGRKKANEVTVVLPPPAPVESDETEAEAETESEAAPVERKPVLVTGKPSEELVSETIEEPAPVELPEADPVVPEVAAPPVAELEDPGLEVRVESIRKGTGKLDPEKIKLRASFPAKPLASPPAGWIMEKSADAPVVIREVELQPGTLISLDITPHILIPDADGSGVFSVTEPGFDTLGGYRQERTVSGILAKSVVQLDEDSKQLGTVLSELQRLLSSLPQPEPKAVPVEEVEQ